MSIKRRFLWLQTISNQACDQIDKEIDKAAMSGMFDLRNVLQLVVDGFDDCAFSEQQFVDPGHQAVLHILANASHQLNIFLKQLGEQVLRDIASVCKELAKEIL